MKIHFVGCEGVSMKVLSRIMASYGHTVSGSDAILSGHNAENIEGAEIVVYTTAVGNENTEVLAAKAKGIPVFERAQFLGEVAKNYNTVVAVSGSHGKTTCTGFIEQIFLPLNPTVHIGGKTLGESGHIGGKDYFICEACEYKRSFLHLKPDIAVILNIELDHTDYYKDAHDYFSAYEEFFKGAKKAVINGDDEECLKLKSEKAVTFGFKEYNDYQAANIVKKGKTRSFDVLKNGEFFLKAEISLPGVHNIYNALSALAAADLAGISKDNIIDGLKNFEGVKRRFEYIGKVKTSRIFTDYAHHPSELKTTIESAREVCKKRVTVVFEPHTYSRTKSLLNEFTQSLSGADRIILVPIFAAREAPIDDITSHILVRELIKNGKHAIHFDTFAGVCDYIKDTEEKDEIIVFTGAGDINKAALNLVRN